MLLYADTDMMQLHLNEISRNVAEGAHAVLLLDRAGWHTTGTLDVLNNITSIFHYSLLMRKIRSMSPQHRVTTRGSQMHITSEQIRAARALLGGSRAIWHARQDCPCRR